MQTNNNPLTEIGAIVLAAVLIIVAGLLVYVGKIDWTAASSAFILAVGVFAGNLALKAPSPTQQAALLQLTTQALAGNQAQPQLVQESAPMATPNNSAAMMEQAAQYANALSTPQFVQPAGIAMPQAMQTTQSYPAAPRQ